MNTIDRKSLRESIRRQRREIPENVRREASHRICQTVARLQCFQAATRVAGFLAFDGEADPGELMTLACQQQKKVFVPIIVAKGQPLLFAPWVPDVAMRKNYFGIEEPDIPRSQWIAANELDFVICPLVAFDQSCERIGVGAGYYDRSFAHLIQPNESEHSPATRATVLVGFAFEIQRLPRIETRAWDVPLDWVVTEKQIYRRRNDS